MLCFLHCLNQILCEQRGKILGLEFGEYIRFFMGWFHTRFCTVFMDFDDNIWIFYNFEDLIFQIKFLQVKFDLFPLKQDEKPSENRKFK